MILIIGGGISGLSAACYLAKENKKVLLIEKNEFLGGRMSSFSKMGFTFDKGPSWYWMPDIFEDFFKDFGKKIEDFYTLKKLDTSYKIFFNKDEIDIKSDKDYLYTLFDKYEENSGYKLKDFLNEARNKYKIAKKFLYKPNININEYFSKDVIPFLKYSNINSHKNYVSSFFTDEKLKIILEWPVLFLGASPDKIPSIYSILNHADLELGTWYPQGGMHNIIKAMVSIAQELGVKIITNEEVVDFNIQNNKIIAVNTKKNKYTDIDSVISCADYAFIESLLPSKYKSYNSKYWETREMSPSSIIYYIGLSEKLPNLDHHNLFFDTSYNKHLNETFNLKILPSEPLFYVCCPSKYDKSVAPDNCENIFILIPCHSGCSDSKEIRDKYFDIVIDRIEKKIKKSIKNKIIFSQSYASDDFKKEYNAFKGNAFGLANTLYQSAILKPNIKSKKITNLYYCGQLTVPGPGVPPCIISGKIVAKYCLSDNNRYNSIISLNNSIRISTKYVYNKLNIILNFFYFVINFLDNSILFRPFLRKISHENIWAEKICSDGSKSFYSASLFFPINLRYDIFKFYSFARITDDMIDNYKENEQLDNFKFISNFVKNNSIQDEKFYYPEKSNVIKSFNIFSNLVNECEIPNKYIQLLINGFKFDCNKIIINTEEDLINYCINVASSIGFICLFIFKKHYNFTIDNELLEEAKYGGIALQLTNIARDILTDLKNNRIYIPSVWLNHSKQELNNPLIARIYSVKLINYSEKYYKKAFNGIKKLPKDIKFSINSAFLIYKQIGENIKKKKELSRREYVDKFKKIKLLSKSYLDINNI